MNTSTRVRKEIRQMQWPWLLVAIAAVLSLQTPYSSWIFIYQVIEWSFFVGLFVGVPLLASLPVGYEFEHRTMPLLLAQPIERSRIWREKHLIAFAATLPLALIFFFSPKLRPPDDSQFWIVAVMWMLCMSAASTFWTTFARSTLGGLVLNTATHVMLLAGWTYAADRLRAANSMNSQAVAIAIVLLACYAITMVWAGRKMFLRQQAIEGISADDPFSRIFRYIAPPILRDWLRCRADSPKLNLLRRELWMLRPVWIFGLLNSLAWIILLLLHQVPRMGFNRDASVAVIVMIVVSPLSAALAGAMSLGEEKTWGTHLWHMTLPISIAKQWMLKLLVAVVAGVVTATGLPLLILWLAGVISGSSVAFLDRSMLWAWPLASAGISLLAFWCSCVVNGTVRAALTMLFVLFALMVAANLAPTITYRLWSGANPLLARLFLYVDPFRFRNDMFRYAPYSLEWLFAFVAAFVIFYSYRLFRAQKPDNTRRIIVSVLPLLGVVLLSSFLFWIPEAFAFAAWQQQDILFHETHVAIENIQSSLTNSDPSHPIQLTVDDLAKAAPLSAGTRHWLAKDSITVERHAESRDFQKCCRTFFSSGDWGKSGEPYIAHLRLRNGMSCEMSYRKNSSGYGALGAECK